MPLLNGDSVTARWAWQSSWLTHLQRAGYHAPVLGNQESGSARRTSRSVGEHERGRRELWHHESAVRSTRPGLLSMTAIGRCCSTRPEMRSTTVAALSRFTLWWKF